MFVVLVDLKSVGIVVSAATQLTCSTLSKVLSDFVFRIKCASSSVIRCCLVSWSVNEPDLALPTPATSAPIPACGAVFASDVQNKMIAGQSNLLHTFNRLSPGLQKSLADYTRRGQEDLYQNLW